MTSGVCLCTVASQATGAKRTYTLWISLHANYSVQYGLLVLKNLNLWQSVCGTVSVLICQHWYGSPLCLRCTKSHCERGAFIGTALLWLWGQTLTLYQRWTQRGRESNQHQMLLYSAFSLVASLTVEFAVETTCLLFGVMDALIAGYVMCSLWAAHLFGATNRRKTVVCFYLTALQNNALCEVFYLYLYSINAIW